ncbi:angiotensin-converting enzyme 2 [Labeo rohita]|uniref:Angiotensin-converting enzyme n=1 Tax=Labeo rohita TaxID=84645 RepID=A0A498NQH2_LABRO|nr:angiotensin-converting enzyme 2 [Labeo rohita]RXN34036.1 angiotensin-converting enzyme 2 [Labeo rohita]
MQHPVRLLPGTIPPGFKHNIAPLGYGTGQRAKQLSLFDKTTHGENNSVSVGGTRAVAMFARWLLLLAVASVACSQTVEDSAREFLQKFDEEASNLMYQYSLASWAYNTDISQENADKEAAAYAIWSEYYGKVSDESRAFPIDQISDPLIKIQLQKLQDKGSGALSPDKATEYHFCCGNGKRVETIVTRIPCVSQLGNIMSEMSTIYNTATVCKIDNPTDCQTLEPGLESIMANSRDYYERLHAWEGWRVAAGMKMRPLYERYVDLKNEAAKLNSDMWGRFWTNLYPLMIPYPEKPDIDVSAEMVAQGWDEMRLFTEAEKFFMSVNMSAMFDNFWTNSMFVKPEGRDVVCHPTAWDMGNREDFRIKMCTKVNMDDFLTVHHEMGHNQYQMAYRQHSYLLRDGANEGFHEAVGEIMSLSAATPSHLKSLGLLPPDFKQDYETDINFLLKQALTIVGTLPFTYMLEEWRWQVFKETIPKQEWMLRWWQMKRELVGVAEPVPRNELYCDPPALFHVSGDYSFIRYFTRTIYQFQFQEALCQAAGHTGPLYTCDITNSTKAGNKLRHMLELGRSMSWTRALEEVAGTTKIDSKPLLNYFSTLMDWLKVENQNNNRVPGWNVSINPTSVMNKADLNAFKVRISLKTAMGDDAYTWNPNEMYLFKSTMAFAMRQYYLEEKGIEMNFLPESINTYDETPRVSFYFVVMDPTKPDTVIPKADVEAAIWLSRDRINGAFLLSDETMEFVGLRATLPPPKEEKITVWLVVFGVVMGVTVFGGIYLITTGILNRKKKAKKSDKTVNPYENSDDGEVNSAFEEHSEQTGL